MLIYIFILELDDTRHNAICNALPLTIFVFQFDCNRDACRELCVCVCTVVCSIYIFIMLCVFVGYKTASEQNTLSVQFEWSNRCLMGGKTYSIVSSCFFIHNTMAYTFHEKAH